MVIAIALAIASVTAIVIIIVVAVIVVGVMSIIVFVTTNSVTSRHTLYPFRFKLSTGSHNASRMALEGSTYSRAR